jgi:uncharacterized membrane protein
MPKMTTQTQAKPLFSAKLTPHRSLGRRGGRVVIALVAVFATIPGIVFFSLGAWPIVGFMGLPRMRGVEWSHDRAWSDMAEVAAFACHTCMKRHVTGAR